VEQAKMEKKTRCFRGYCPNECPLKDIETEKVLWIVVALLEAGVVLIKVVL
jgi:hypothetical protein